MKKQKLTGWYAAHQKPARVGWYDTTLVRGRVYQWFWDGNNWTGAYGYTSLHQDRKWRGIAK